VPERKVVRKHAFRAGLTPIVTSAGLDFAGLLGGAVIIESVFGLPGIGRLAIDSVQQYDLPVLLGTTLLAAAIVIVAMAIVEILYVLIDPRVQIDG
jgi:peptide/nickel transport system permease protein